MEPIWTSTNFKKPWIWTIGFLLEHLNAKLKQLVPDISDQPKQLKQTEYLLQGVFKNK